MSVLCLHVTCVQTVVIQNRSDQNVPLGLIPSISAAKQHHPPKGDVILTLFVCRITVSLAHCPHPRGILFFEVHPSQCIVFVMAIQRELPITLLIRKGL